MFILCLCGLLLCFLNVGLHFVMQADPYLKGVVIPVQDRVPESVSRLSPKVMQVKEALCTLNSLEIKLKV